MTLKIHSPTNIRYLLPDCPTVMSTHNTYTFLPHTQSNFAFRITSAQNTGPVVVLPNTTYTSIGICSEIRASTRVVVVEPKNITRQLDTPWMNRMEQKKLCVLCVCMQACFANTVRLVDHPIDCAVCVRSFVQWRPCESVHLISFETYVEFRIVGFIFLARFSEISEIQTRTKIWEFHARELHQQFFYIGSAQPRYYTVSANK